MNKNIYDSVISELIVSFFNEKDNGGLIMNKIMELKASSSKSSAFEKSKGQPGGLATLNDKAKVPLYQLRASLFGYVGMRETPTITLHTNNTKVNIAASKCFLYHTPAEIYPTKKQAHLREYIIPAINDLDIPEGRSFIKVKADPTKDYPTKDALEASGGGPVEGTTATMEYISEELRVAKYYIETTEADIDEKSVIPVYSIYREGDDIYYVSWDSLGERLPNKLHQRVVFTEQTKRESGLILSSVDGSNDFLIDGGKLWNGAVRHTLANIDSTVPGQVILKVKANATGTTWTTTRPTTGYLSTQYQKADGTGLVDSTDGKWVVNWIYRMLDEDAKATILVGESEYDTVEAAKLEATPSAIPNSLVSHGVLVGRIIALNRTTPSVFKDEVESAFKIFFSSSSVTRHNDLADLKGHADYYHVSNDELTGLTNGEDAVPKGANNPLGGNAPQLHTHRVSKLTEAWKYSLRATTEVELISAVNSYESLKHLDVCGDGVTTITLTSNLVLPKNMKLKDLVIDTASYKLIYIGNEAIIFDHCTILGVGESVECPHVQLYGSRISGTPIINCGIIKMTHNLSDFNITIPSSVTDAYVEAFDNFEKVVYITNNSSLKVREDGSAVISVTGNVPYSWETHTNTLIDKSAEKAVVVNNDEFLITDSEDSKRLKKAKVGTLMGNLETFTKNNKTGYRLKQGTGNDLDYIIGNYAIDLVHRFSFDSSPTGYGASGTSAFAAGYNNRAHADMAAVFGRGNTVEGRQGFAFGSNNRVTGHDSLAGGKSVNIDGDFSLGVGENNTISGTGAIVGGDSNTVAAWDSLTGGSNNKNLGSNSVVAGEGCESWGKNSLIVGKGLNSDRSEKLVVGKYNAPSSSNVFEIGGGTDNNNRNNLFYVTDAGHVHATRFISSESDILMGRKNYVFNSTYTSDVLVSNKAYHVIITNGETGEVALPPTNDPEIGATITIIKGDVAGTLHIKSELHAEIAQGGNYKVGRFATLTASESSITLMNNGFSWILINSNNATLINI